jgi:hypothetical protein
MGHFQRFSRLSVIAMLPLVACGGNTIQLGEDKGTGGTGAGAGGSTSSGTGGYGLGGSSGSGNPGGGTAGPDAGRVVPAACALPEQGIVSKFDNQAALASLLVGRWELCEAVSPFGTSDEAGIVFDASGTWAKLYRNGQGGLDQGAGFDRQGEWDVYDTTAMNGPGALQLNIHVDGSETIDTFPVFSTVPRKLRINNNGVFIASYVFVDSPDGGPPHPPVVCPAENPTMLTETGTMMNSAETADGGVCPCTRRPAGTPDMACAAGDGTSVTFLMTPQGGSFSLGGWQAQQSGVYVRLDVPQGALSAPTWITLTETTCPPPASYVDASPLYQFAPADLVFSRPINVRIPYGASGRFPPTQSIYLSAAGDTYERVPDSYINAGFMQGSITHFGFIFAGYPKSPEQATCP